MLHVGLHTPTHGHLVGHQDSAAGLHSHSLYCNTCVEMSWRSAELHMQKGEKGGRGGGGGRGAGTVKGICGPPDTTKLAECSSLNGSGANNDGTTAVQGKAA